MTPSPPITAEAALEVVRSAATERGWPWFEPTSVRYKRPLLGRPRWEIVTNIESRGQNVRASVDVTSGEVVRISFGPR